MKTADLPLSENVEDRRCESSPTVGPRFTLAELVKRGLAVAFNAIPGSRIAKDAGVDDLDKTR
jgi:hypothetical protein